VSITSPTNNQVLTYDSASSLWVNANNPADGVTSITATAPLTGGTITSTGSIGLDQTALSITKSQVSDFTSGTVTSASTAQQAGTALFANTSGTATYSTTSGTALTISGDITKSQVSDFTSGTVASAGTAQQAGTAVYALTSGTATFATNSGTAVFATNASTAVSVSGSAITQSQVVNLVSDLANTAKLNTANTFTVGNQVINTGANANKGLSINANGASQSANLFEAVGNSTVSVSGSGLLVASAAIQTTGFRNSSVQTVLAFNSAGHNLFSNNPTAGNVGLVLRGAASQSADLLQLQNSAGTNLVRADQFGGLFSTYANFTSDAAGTLPLRVRGASGQTADLTQWQNSGATVLSEITSTGSFYVNTNNNTSGIEFLATSGTSLITSNGNDLNVRPRFDLLFAPADSSGRLRPSNDNTSDLGISANRWRNIWSSGLNVINSNAANLPVLVRGAASQTANLQDWQNSAGTQLAFVGNLGSIFATDLRTINTFGLLGEANSGGRLRMVRATSANSNPGANVGVIYFRDGTNAGTLKLVVRAGAAGAETTILDNIPQ
jgi:hypothetical protein